MLKNVHKQRLKAMAHGKKPVVIIGGNGLTDAVLQEIDQALNDHELIKVRVNAADREQRSAMINQIEARLSTTVVQQIGHIAVFYRPHPEQPKLVIK